MMEGDSTYNMSIKYFYLTYFMARSMLRTLSIWNFARIVLDPLFFPNISQSREGGAKPLEVHGIENIVIISQEVCGGDDMGEGGEVECLDIIAAG
jgi:hypothetical protein